jgi:predicted phosphodiesterase
MKLEYISDIHLESNGTDPYKLFQESKLDTILLLLGDIGNLDTDEYLKFIKHISKLYKYVVLVLGNHEFYCTRDQYSTINDLKSKLKRNIDITYHNVFLLDNNCFDIDGTNYRLIGTTMWSDVSEEAAAQMNDYRSIYKKCDPPTRITSKDVVTMFKKNKKWVLDELKIAKKEQKKCILLTHHAVNQVANGEFLNTSLFTTAYATDIKELKKFENTLIYCINGHTHVSMKKKDNIVIPNTNIQLLANCYGYPGEQDATRFTKLETLEIE